MKRIKIKFDKMKKNSLPTLLYIQLHRCTKNSSGSNQLRVHSTTSLQLFVARFSIHICALYNGLHILPGL